jgi:dTMP kinase
LIVVFDVDERVAATRLNPLLDRMEQKGEAFHRRVRQGYLDQANAEPDRHLVIDATQDVDEVEGDVLRALKVWMERETKRQ